MPTRQAELDVLGVDVARQPIAIRKAAEGQALAAGHVTASSMAGILDDFAVRHNDLFSRMCNTVTNGVGGGEGEEQEQHP